MDSRNVEVQEALKRLKEVMLAFGHRSRDGDDVKTLADYLAGMREAEKKRMTFQRKSPQIKLRKTLVHMMMRIGGEQKMYYDCVYLAIYLLDTFMDHHDIQPPTLPYVAVACLVISGKLLGCKRNPLYRDFCKYVSCSTHVDNRRQMLVGVESFILEAFRFRIYVPTEINFLDVYLLYAVDGKGAHEIESQNNNTGEMPNANYPNSEGIMTTHSPEARTCTSDASLLTNIYETAFFIIEFYTRVGPPGYYPPSLVAAAVLMAARREHGLNFWTPTLREVTSYSLSVVHECLQKVIEPYISQLEWTRPFTPPEFLNVPNLPNLIETVMRIS